MKRLRNGNNVSVRNLPLRLKFYSDRAFSGQRARHGRKYNRTQFLSDFSAEKASVLFEERKRYFADCDPNHTAENGLKKEI